MRARTTSTPGWPDPDRALTEALEAALQRISRLLVSNSGENIDAVLSLLGDALDADAVSFVSAPAVLAEDQAPPVAPTYLREALITWARGAETTHETIDSSLSDGPSWYPPSRAATGTWPIETVERHALAVPLLTEDERLVGYLSIVRRDVEGLSRGPYGRALSVISDMMATYLNRLALEESRAQTEERWRQLVDRHPDPTLVLVHGVVSYANDAARTLLDVKSSDAVVGRPLEDFVSADEIGEIVTDRDAQLLTGRPVPFEHHIIRSDGDERIVESVFVPFPGTAGGTQMVLRDVTERKASEERYRTFIQTISEGVWRVQVDRGVSRHASPRAQADHILEHGRIADINPAMVQILGYTRRLSAGMPVRYVVGPYARAMVRALVSSGYVLRAFEITTRDNNGTRHFSVNAIGRLERDELVEIWGSCTEITERVEMERQLVNVLEEQQERIGRDLHDSIGQLLTGVRMLSEGLAGRAEGGPEEETAARIAAYSAEALDRVRDICHGLVPPQLYSEGAAGALAQLVEHVDALGQVRCVFRRERAADLSDPASALQAYRIVQEAISNALRHANAEVVWVYLGYDEADVVVEIEDDGIGFELTASRARSIGLYGMYRRASSVGASLAIETHPGAGTTVRLTFPNLITPSS